MSNEPKDVVEVANAEGVECSSGPAESAAMKAVEGELGEEELECVAGGVNKHIGNVKYEDAKISKVEAITIKQTTK